MNPLMFQPRPCGPSVNFLTVLSWPRRLLMNSLPVLLRLQRPLLTSQCSLFQLSLIHPGCCLLHHEDLQSRLLCCGISSSACSTLVFFSSAASALVVFSSTLVLLSSACSALVLLSSACSTMVLFKLLLLYYSTLRLCLLRPGGLQLISSACSALVGISSTLASLLCRLRSHLTLVCSCYGVSGCPSLGREGVGALSQSLVGVPMSYSRGHSSHTFGHLSWPPFPRNLCLGTHYRTPHVYNQEAYKGCTHTLTLLSINL